MLHTHPARTHGIHASEGCKGFASDALLDEVAGWEIVRALS